MSLSRKFLSAMGIDEDKVDEIIKAHTETVDALKEQRDTYKTERDSYKTEAEKLPKVQKELDDMKAAAEKGGKDTYKVKYEALKEDFDKYKKEQAEKETHEKKVEAYKGLLKEAGVSEKRIDAVLRVSDVDSIEFEDDGKIKDAGTIKKDIVKEWEDFIVKEDTQGANTSTPPAGNGKTYKSMDEIMAITDASVRQQAIAENHELFGF